MASHFHPSPHFYPRFPSADPSLELASGMFGAFVFRKSSHAPPPARLGAPPGMAEMASGGESHAEERGSLGSDEGGGDSKKRKL